MSRFVRSGPANSRALWHIANPSPRASNVWTLCGNVVSGPETDSWDEVTASDWPPCGRCLERREAKIAEAKALIVALDWENS